MGENTKPVVGALFYTRKALKFYQWISIR